MPRNEKTFDCIAFKREAQQRIYDRTQTMTPQQEIAYFQKAVREGPFHELWADLTHNEDGERTDAASDRA